VIKHKYTILKLACDNIKIGISIGNVCTHVGGPLDEGTLEGYEVECPWHGSKFDVRTGEPTKPPARQAVPTYEVKLEDNNILVRKRK
jgi:nitrite reductase/ring-hydroxylating ferredoxin subunit